MILVKVKGGTGNQLFQYAFGYALSQHHETDLKLDLRHFSGETLHPLSLDNFGLSYETVDKSDLQSVIPFGSRGLEFAKRLHSRIPHAAKIACQYHTERAPNSFWQKFGVPCKYTYQPAVFSFGENGYFDGYWQTSRYFSSYASKLRDLFEVATPLEGDNKTVANAITDSTSIALHVRRGDYVDTGNALPRSYYNKAIDVMAESTSEPHFFVFSDDIEWARNNLSTPGHFTFVTHNDGETDYEDLRLMRMCTHNVISNSTFSWWGAWLNDDREKQVIAPSYWFGDHATRDIEIIPEDWEILEPRTV